MPRGWDGSRSVSAILSAPGVSVTAAAVVVGCSRQTASKWLNRRRRGRATHRPLEPAGPLTRPVGPEDVSASTLSGVRQVTSTYSPSGSWKPMIHAVFCRERLRRLRLLTRCDCEAREMLPVKEPGGRNGRGGPAETSSRAPAAEVPRPRAGTEGQPLRAGDAERHRRPSAQIPTASLGELIPIADTGGLDLDQNFAGARRARVRHLQHHHTATEFFDRCDAHDRSPTT